MFTKINDGGFNARLSETDWHAHGGINECHENNAQSY